jgi:hypothetical protein
MVTSSIMVMQPCTTRKDVEQPLDLLVSDSVDHAFQSADAMILSVSALPSSPIAHHHALLKPSAN